MQKIIIDTDIGSDIDDALALAFALLRPELDVKAITTVYGRTDLRARLTAKLLRIMGREDVPVAPGLRLPLESPDDERRRRLEENVPCQCAFVPDDEELPPFASEDAVAFMKDIIEQNPGEVAIVTIGALSNLGALLRDHAGLCDKIPFVSMMGGNLELNRREHNINCDPDAARIVFESGVPMFLGTWEVTRRVVMLPPQIDILANVETPLCRALSELIQLWMPHRGAKRGPVLYDVSAVLACFDRKYFAAEPKRVCVETKGEFTRAYTVVMPGDPNMEVTTDINERAVLRLFMDTVTQS